VKKLNKREVEIVRWLSKNGQGSLIKLKALLEENFFNSDSSRCLIIQPVDQYAMYFLDVNRFNNEEQKNDEVALLIELMALLQYLDSQGHITVFRSEHSIKEKIFFFSELFNSPKIESGKIVLNQDGLHSTRPETIKDTNGEVIFKGVEFKGCNYELIFQYCTGDICISSSIDNLLYENDQKVKEKEKIQPHISRISKGLSIAAIIVIVVVLCASYFDTRWRLEELTLTINDFQKLDRMSSGNSVVGIDISRWNGNALEEVKLIDKLDFVIVKATQGVNEVDPLFKENWLKLERLGMTKGAYHFYVAGQDPNMQAEHFWSQISDLSKSDLPPIVDVERAGIVHNPSVEMDNFQLDLMIFIKKLEQLSGVTPMLYASTSFADKYIKHISFSDYPLWLADYTDDPTPNVPKVWKEKGFSIWQKSDSYNLGSAKFDYDVANRNFVLPSK